VALFSALPHGEAAASLAPILTDAERSGHDLRVVDLSADFRHRDAHRYAALYGKAHAAPELLARFVCALPEHGGAGEAAPRWVAHPGCFTTAATLALAPLVAGGWIEPPATVVAVTGSTGAGRTPSATTHHPERRSDLFAYSPFTHRHEPEMRALVAAAAGSAAEPEILFVPHSGPFARGIHATITARLARPGHSDEIAQFVASFYKSLSPLPSFSPGASSFSAAASPSFVHVLAAPPRLQAVVGTNRCDLAFAVRDDRLVAFAAIDNLVKGAAGGAIQWMNRLCGLPEASGLTLPGLGWL
jgi:N-acetyl-gamma-glutamyl-phosphate reductase